MKAWVEVCSRTLRMIGWTLGSFILWTLWLALTALVFLQLYIITANELSIPEPVLRHLESKLAEAGIRATFSRTSFDPSGRVLMENVRISLPAYAEPVLTCRSIFVELSPYYLAMGRIEPRNVRVNDVSVFVPAMLSDSGRPEELVRDLDVTMHLERRAVTIQQLSAVIADVPVSAHGVVMIPPSRTDKPATEKFDALIAQRFPKLCRQALEIRERISQLEEPALHLEFTPSASGAPHIQVLALARAARLAKPFAAEATDLRIATRVLLFGDTPSSEVDVSTRHLTLPGETRISGLQAHMVGRVQLDAGKIEIREVTATAHLVENAGVDARGISAQIYPRPLPRLETQAVASILGAPLALRADVDFEERSAAVQFEGRISPQVPDVLTKRLNASIKKYADYDVLTVDRGEARFGANWKFEKLTARVDVPRITAQNVQVREGHAEIDLRPDRLYAPYASVRVGNSFAFGSYEHEFATNRYRFLLEGSLQPLDISEWFREWWTRFFTQVQFPLRAPVANVDVRGAWRDGRQSNIFIFADVPKATVLGTELDRVRTRMFIRPSFFDGLELLALRGHGSAHGRFTYTNDYENQSWRTLDLGFDSTFDLNIAAKLLGPAGAKTLEPFRLSQPPHLKVRGQFAAAEAAGGAQEKLRIEARTAGEFRFHGFPLQDVNFIATIDREEIVLDEVEARFGGGLATGHARVSGTGDQRRLGFDFALEDASLGKVAASLAEFFAAKKGEAPAPPGKFVQEKANVHLNFAASAEGRYDDPLSYRGEGSAVLHGAEIGEVALLGSLSELLKFTALRFTEARTNFKIESNKLVFPEVTLRGSNSAIDAHGSYAMDRQELEFNAKIFPFQESDNLLKTVVGAVLTPLSNAFEVKLSGTFTKPQWAFVMGPTNFLRSLVPGSDAGTKTETSSDDKDVKAAKPSTPASTSSGADRQ